MEKFVPFEKLSKKEKRKINLAKRNDWNGLNPSTRIAETDTKKYVGRMSNNYLVKFDGDNLKILELPVNDENCYENIYEIIKQYNKNVKVYYFNSLPFHLKMKMLKFQFFLNLLKMNIN